MNVLGIDVSTMTGVAVVNSVTKKIIHTEELHYKKLTGMPRVHALAMECMRLRDHYQCKASVIEDYAVGKFAGSAIVSIEIGAVLRLCLWQDDHPYLTVTPTSLKKFVTGSGNAKKDLMILEVFKRWGFESATNNIADAVSLAKFGAYAISPDPALRKDSFKVVSDALKTQPEFVAAAHGGAE